MSEPMTEADWQELRRLSNSWGMQDENGIDLSLIDQMLSLTPTQRLESLDRWLAFAALLHKASVKYYGFDPRTAVEAGFGGR
jgi:hypothetical protein